MFEWRSEIWLLWQFFSVYHGFGWHRGSSSLSVASWKSSSSSSAEAAFSINIPSLVLDWTIARGCIRRRRSLEKSHRHLSYCSGLDLTVKEIIIQISKMVNNLIIIAITLSNHIVHDNVFLKCCLDILKPSLAISLPPLKNQNIERQLVKTFQIFDLEV